MTNKIKQLLDTYPKKIAAIGSPSDSFEVTLDILGDSTQNKILGEFVYFQTVENGENVVSLGQITEVMTSNKWHEEPSFKAVIKRHGSLPHLSGDADNRIATLNVQSTFKILSGNEVKAHKLSNSPSTGMTISSVTNEIMQELTKPICEGYKSEVIGNAYDTNVKIPFWFRHFGRGHNGAGDAYHIGVFGKTGSGKTTTAAKMIAGYAGNHKDMSILILDPQEQFYNEDKIIPEGKFKDLVISKGISPENYRAIVIPEDVALPDSADLFAELMLSTGLVQSMFNLKTDDTKQLMAEGIEDYLIGRYQNTYFSLKNQRPEVFLKEMLTRFITLSKAEKDFTRYVSNVYLTKNYATRLQSRIEQVLNALTSNSGEFKAEISSFINLFSLFKSDSNEDLATIVENILTKPGYLYIINLSPRANANSEFKNDNFQAKLIEVVLTRLIERAEIISSEKKKANTLIVMDEAHRYVNSSATDERLKQLNKKIIDSVRTVRKYGIGHMFITQTIDSIDQEVIQQMRIFSFGFGLTMGTEFSKIKQIINDENAAKFYRSFIDPSSNGKYPFMFHGPISPLSFTGSPLFIEMN